MRNDRSLVLVMPSQPHVKFQLFECSTQEGFLDVLDFIPEEARGSETAMLYSVEDYIADLMLLPGYKIEPKHALNWYRNAGVTHLAMLALPNEHPATMWWGEKQFQLGFVVYFCAAHNKYRLLHCNDCATVVRGWLKDMQDEWGSLYAVGGAVQKEGKTYN